MRILIVSQYFWPENFSVNTIAKYLTSKGHKVDVLTGLPNYPQGKVYEGYTGKENRHQKYEECTIDRVWIKERGQKGGDKRLILNYLSYVVNASCNIMTRLGKKYDATFVYEVSPITQAIPALLLRKLKKVPMCLYVADLWPDTLFSHGMNSGTVKKILTRACSHIYRRTDNIVIVNESFRKPIEKYTDNKRTITYIPQSADPVYKPLEPSGVLRKQLGLCADDLIIMFAGNLGFAQSVKTVVEAANKVSHQKDIHFVFVGDGTLRAECEEYCKANNLNNCHFIGKKKPDEMPGLIAEANAMLVTLKNQSNYNLTLPGRTQSFMACAKPIICCANGETARVVKAAKCGLVSEAENSDKLAESIVKFSTLNATERNALAESGLQYSRDNYDQQTMLQNIEKVLAGMRYAK